MRCVSVIVLYGRLTRTERVRQVTEQVNTSVTVIRLNRTQDYKGERTDTKQFFYCELFTVKYYGKTGRNPSYSALLW
jgi:single-stranded DNA-binding protein